jgi:micrococcal nuclease
MFEYDALVTRVVDGDTFDLQIDLGFGIIKKTRLRLYGIDTPEIRGEESARGLAVKEAVRILIEGKMVRVKTHKFKGKYGRYVAKVLAYVGTLDMDLTEYLISMQMGKRVDYG